MPPSQTDVMDRVGDKVDLEGDKVDLEAKPLIESPTSHNNNNDRSKRRVPEIFHNLTSTTRWTFIQGVLLSTLSGMLFTANNFIIKGYNVVPVDAILVRGVVQVVFLTLYSCIRKYSLLPDTRRKFTLVMAQGMCGAFSFISALLAVSRMPVADALVVMFSDPLVTMVGATIFLGEKMNIVKLWTGVSILAGVTLVCKPPFIFTGRKLGEGIPHDMTYWTGAAFAMSAVMSGLLHNLIVPVCKDIESVVLVVWVGLCAILTSLVVGQFDSSAELAIGRVLEVEPAMWAIFFGLAASGMVAYVCLTKSLQLISPTLVASLRSLEIVFAFIVESAIFCTPPSYLSILGGSLVILGVSCIAFEAELLGWFPWLSPVSWWRSRRSGYQAL